MIHLYDLPNWLLGAVVIGCTVGSMVGLYLVSRLLFRISVSDEEKSLAMTVLPIIATVHSLLLAFSAVSVWESYSAAEASVFEEANTIGQLSRDLAIYDSPESVSARRLLRAYTQHVVDEEWDGLQHGIANQDTWDNFDRLFRAIGTLRPDTPQQAALMPEVWARTNELVERRRERLSASESEIPGTLWSVVLIGTVLTFLTTVVLPATRFNVSMIVMLATSIGLVFFFLVAMDRPFAGKESISATPFTTAITSIDDWDAASRAGR